MMEDINKNPESKSLNEQVTDAFTSNSENKPLSDTEKKQRQTMTSINNRPKKGLPNSIGHREYTGPDLSHLKKPDESNDSPDEKA